MPVSRARAGAGSALAVLLLAQACGGGEYTDAVGPGSEPPAGAPPDAEYTDESGRLYALTWSTASGASLVVVNARSGSIAGSRALGAIDPGGFSVDALGNAFIGDRAASVVHRVSPDLSHVALPVSDSRVIASAGTRTAVVGEDAVAALDLTTPVALPASDGLPIAAALGADASRLAIAREGSPAEVQLVSFGLIEATAWGFELVSPGTCAPEIDDIAFPRFGSTSHEWRAVDSTCGRLYGGGVLQDSSATLVLTSSAGTHLALDGWSGDAWVAGESGVLRIDGGGDATAIAAAPGTVALALANAGTRAWAATSSTSGAPALVQLTKTASQGVLATIGSAGDSILALEYVDRPPVISAPMSATADGCGTGWVQFAVSAHDPDGDGGWLWLDEGSTGSFDPEDGIYRGQFSDHGDFSYDGTASFTAITGQWLTHVSVEIWVPRCHSTGSGSDDDSYEEDDHDYGGGCGCACTCTVGSNGHAPPLGSAAVIAASSMFLWRRRRGAHA